MNDYFSDADAFRRALRARRVRQDDCWGCSSRGQLVSLDLRQDFDSLGLPAERRMGRINLCPSCAASYMNSFNETMDRKKGRKGCHCCRWTAEKILDSLADTAR